MSGHSAEKATPVEMTAERLGENLRRAIKASGLTQAEVAERCEMDQTALSKALAGKRRVSSLKLALLCTATGSDVLGVLEAEPLHGPSYRKGLEEGYAHMARAWDEGYLQADDDYERVRNGGDPPEDALAANPYRRISPSEPERVTE